MTMTEDTTPESLFEPDDGTYPPDDDKRKPRLTGGNVKGSRARLLARERQRRALELRKAGSTYAAIAQALGYADHTSARQAVVRAFDEIIREPAIDLRGIQYERLNHMLLVLWPKVQGGDERAIGQALAVMDKMDRLMGTEESQKIDVDVNVAGAVLVIDGNKDEYIAAMKRMAGYAEDAELNQPQQPMLTKAGVDLPQTHQPDDDIIDAEVIEPVPVKKVAPRMKTKPKPRAKTLPVEVDDA